MIVAHKRASTLASSARVTAAATAYCDTFYQEVMPTGSYTKGNGSWAFATVRARRIMRTALFGTGEVCAVTHSATHTVTHHCCSDSAPTSRCRLEGQRPSRLRDPVQTTRRSWRFGATRSVRGWLHCRQRHSHEKSGNGRRTDVRRRGLGGTDSKMSALPRVGSSG